jgi:hypothetical protein
MLLFIKDNKDFTQTLLYWLLLQIASEPIEPNENFHFYPPGTIDGGAV